MNEGIKVYLRIAYSLCAILKDQILEEKDASSMKNTIKIYSLNMDDTTTKAMFKVKNYFFIPLDIISINSIFFRF